MTFYIHCDVNAGYVILGEVSERVVASLYGRLLALPTNIRLSWRVLERRRGGATSREIISSATHLAHTINEPHSSHDT